MITIAPPELCSGITSGSTVKLMDLITRANIRDHVPAINTHPLNQPCLRIQYENRKTGKYFYQNCCWTAMGKCDRCRAPECTDRDWRNRGYVP
jgi:hypothetical protein